MKNLLAEQRLQTRDPLTSAIRDHYDRLSLLYQTLWGEHLHHGYWMDGGETPSKAQEQLVQKLAETARIRRDSTVLDVGCGVGGSACWLAEKLDCRVHGLTISPVQAKSAEKNARRRGLESKVRFKVADAGQWPVSSGAYDAVWVVEASEHLDDKAKFIRDSARALNPGGVLALCAWLDNSRSEADRKFVADISDRMLCPSLAGLDDYENWMRSSGLDIAAALDISSHVKKTWDVCLALLDRWEVRAFLGLADVATRRFAESFSMMKEAYDRGVMRYGLFSARKAGGPGKP